MVISGDKAVCAYHFTYCNHSFIPQHCIFLKIRYLFNRIAVKRGDFEILWSKLISKLFDNKTSQIRIQRFTPSYVSFSELQHSNLWFSGCCSFRLSLHSDLASLDYVPPRGRYFLHCLRFLVWFIWTLDHLVTSTYAARKA